MKFNLKNRPNLNDKQFRNWCMDTFEDQKEKYYKFIKEQEKWFEGFEKELKEKLPEILEAQKHADLNLQMRLIDVEFQIREILGEDSE